MLSPIFTLTQCCMAVTTERTFWRACPYIYIICRSRLPSTLSTQPKPRVRLNASHPDTPACHSHKQGDTKCHPYSTLAHSERATYQHRIPYLVFPVSIVLIHIHHLLLRLTCRTHTTNLASTASGLLHYHDAHVAALNGHNLPLMLNDIFHAVVSKKYDDAAALHGNTLQCQICNLLCKSSDFRQI